MSVAVVPRPVDQRHEMPGAVAAVLRIASLRKLGATMRNGVERNLYLGAAAALAQQLSDPGPT